jgi:hypothetical protein
MWSLGCVAAELFLGLPLFPAQCAYDLLLFIKEKLRFVPCFLDLSTLSGGSSFLRSTNFEIMMLEQRNSPSEGSNGALLSEDSWFDESCFHANLGYLWNCDVTVCQNPCQSHLMSLLSLWVVGLRTWVSMCMICPGVNHLTTYYGMPSAQKSITDWQVPLHIPVKTAQMDNHQPLNYLHLTKTRLWASSIFTPISFFFFPLCLTSSCF